MTTITRNKIEISEYPLKDIYNSEPIVDIRNSILDGSFKYCSKELCPHLSKLVNQGIATGPIQLKSNSHYTSPIIRSNTPDYLVMNFDRTCNYKCPSCRVDLIVESSEGIQRIEKTINEIDEYMTSKTCHNCKNIKNDLGSNKIYNCMNCNIKIDRDINASINIYNL